MLENNIGKLCETGKRPKATVYLGSYDDVSILQDTELPLLNELDFDVTYIILQSPEGD